MKKLQKPVTIILAICILAIGFLYVNNQIGIQKAKLETDARSSQKIGEAWLSEKDISDTMAAFIFYPKDKSDHTFSIYINRPGLSFGYFFRGGGGIDIIESEEYITEFIIEDFNERAFISMNASKVERLEIDDGNIIQTIEVDSEKPFAFVLANNIGSVTFYDIEGNVVEILRHPL